MDLQSYSSISCVTWTKRKSTVYATGVGYLGKASERGVYSKNNTTTVCEHTKKTPRRPSRWQDFTWKAKRTSLLKRTWGFFFRFLRGVVLVVGFQLSMGGFIQNISLLSHLPSVSKTRRSTYLQFSRSNPLVRLKKGFIITWKTESCLL